MPAPSQAWWENGLYIFFEEFSSQWNIGVGGEMQGERLIGSSACAIFIFAYCSL